MPQPDGPEGVVIMVGEDAPPILPRPSGSGERIAVFVGDPEDPASAAAAREMQAELFRS